VSDMLTFSFFVKYSIFQDVGSRRVSTVDKQNGIFSTTTSASRRQKGNEARDDGVAVASAGLHLAFVITDSVITDARIMQTFFWSRLSLHQFKCLLNGLR